MGTHKWALDNVYIGISCPKHCLGRGSCIKGKCICEENYSGEYCEKIYKDNIVRIEEKLCCCYMLNYVILHTVLLVLVTVQFLQV